MAVLEPLAVMPSLPHVVVEIKTASELLRASTSGHLVISTIHANNLEDGLNSVIKYASASGMNEGLAADLLARGILGVIHQSLIGINHQKRPVVQYLFANPISTMGDQTRNIIKSGKINLATTIEMQMTRMMQGRPLFDRVEPK